MKFTRSRSVRVSVGLAVCCALLAGCVPLELMGAREGERGLEFMACSSISTQAIEVYASRADSNETPPELVWRSTGSASIGAGDVVQYGVGLPGMTTELGPLPINLSDSVVGIEFDHFGATGVLLDENHAKFSGDEITSSDWLDESGDHSNDPCQ